MKSLIMFAVTSVIVQACAYSSHAVRAADLGKPIRAAEMEAQLDLPGPVTVDTIVAADWVVSLAGLVNLDHPKAKAAGLVDREEPIQIYMFALRHPTRGLWLVDTGIAKELRDHPSDVGVGWLVARAAHLDKLTVRNALGPWLARQGVPLAGVLLTHLHIDHISGVPDVPRGTPIYAGPNETKVRSAQNLVLSGSIDGLLEGQAPLSQWQFAADADGKFAGIIDVFGDGTVFAVHVPGHTAGSTVYLVRTAEGPVLLTGDTCHTRWGWENGVEPGDYTDDRPANALQLSKLKELVARHPRMMVRLGHQP